MPECRHAITGHSTEAETTAPEFFPSAVRRMIFFIMKNEPEC